MFTISKVFTFLSPLPVWKQGIQWQISKQISTLFFQMSAQVYSAPCQTEGKRKAFLDWKNILILKQTLICGSNVNCYKSVHHPTCGNREYTGNFQNKSVSSPFNWVSRCILFLAKLKRIGRSFFEGCKKGGHIVRLGPRALGCHKAMSKGLSYCETWNNSTLSLFLLDSHTNKYFKTWSSMINLWIDSRMYHK